MLKNMLAIIHNEKIDIRQFYESLPPIIRAHSEKVAALTGMLLEWAIAQEMFDGEIKSIERIRQAVAYHDIGLTLIPERILLKREDLTGAEYRVIQQHAQYGGSLLDQYRKENSFEEEENRFWQFAAEIALTHHERWDGKGYPNGQRTTTISFVARTVAIADAYDTMIRGSVYRMPLPSEYALLEILQNAGKQFDPQLTELFRNRYHIISEQDM